MQRLVQDVKRVARQGRAEQSRDELAGKCCIVVPGCRVVDTAIMQVDRSGRAVGARIDCVVLAAGGWSMRRDAARAGGRDQDQDQDLDQDQN